MAKICMIMVKQQNPKFNGPGWSNVRFLALKCTKTHNHFYRYFKLKQQCEFK